MASFYGDASDNTLVGGALADRLFGQGGNDTLTGAGGNDLMYGGTGADIMNGGAGNDSYSVDQIGDQVIEQNLGGIDKVTSTISYTLGDFLENLVLSGVSAINGTGNELANRIEGNRAANQISGLEGNDVLIGGSGNDTLLGGVGNDALSGGIGADVMRGGSGDDAYSVDDTGDQVSEIEGGADAGGNDRVSSSVSFTLGSYLENLTLTGSAALNGTGNNLTNQITGNGAANTLSGAGGDDTLVGGSGNDGLLGGSGNDILSGGLGSDAMDGGTGDDVYQVDAVGDTVSEEASAGTDRVESSLSYALADFLENLTLTGAANINGTGNSLDNEITGNRGSNKLDGGLGSDRMSGGAGHDTYQVNAAGDVAIEVVDGRDQGGVDRVNSAVTFALGAGIENLFLTGAAAINGTGNGLVNQIAGNAAANTLIGGAGNDTLSGGSGNDILRGDSGADAMYGGVGNDAYAVDNAGDKVIEDVDGNDPGGEDTVSSSITYVLGARLENLTLTGLAAINGTGNSSNNEIIGNGSANVLNGKLGADIMQGGAGNDSYTADNVGDRAVENSGGGTDSLTSSVSFTLGLFVENLTLTDSALNGTGNAEANQIVGTLGNNTLSGMDGNDHLIGGAGIDTLLGGLGADKMEGGSGNDIYQLDNAGDTIVETFSGGTDQVNSSRDYTLVGTNLENLTLTGAALVGIGNTAANKITGNSLVNDLQGREGNDTLDGAGGADTMTGGTGDDIYFVDVTGDTTVETSSSGGTDTVNSSVTLTLATLVEKLVLTGNAAIDGTGNELGNTITGNSAVNTLRGNTGVDTLDGAGGADFLYGGSGNDTYVVDNINDKAIEVEGGLDQTGTDHVESFVTFTIGASVEHLTLKGGLAINGTGNISANDITGNDAANTLSGDVGEDELRGMGGIDTLLGGADDDLLIGGLGADLMTGGDGNDSYFVDNTSDVVTESNLGGTDDVSSNVTFTLTEFVEKLVLTGSTDIHGTGNAGDNTINGNFGANVLTGHAGKDLLTGFSGNDTLVGGADNDTLSGGTGADNMQGGTGNDTYNVDNSGDTITEDSTGLGGTDSVSSTVDFTLGNSVENLSFQTGTAVTGVGNVLDNIITGNSNNNTLIGDAGADTLSGGSGNDTLRGGLGIDTLTGGTGVDTFVFAPAVSGNQDIVKFFAADDQLSMSAAEYGGGLTAGLLAEDRFVSAAGITNGTLEKGQFLFNTDNDTLLWDANGSLAGGAVLVATFESTDVVFDHTAFVILA
jgi:Ca2+-binding RTX toxin-like protein